MKALAATPDYTKMVAGNLAFIFIGVFFLYLANLFFELLVFPFTKKYVDPEESYRGKIQDREDYRHKMALTDNPLKNYCNRYLENSGNTPDASEKLWFEAFKEGRIADPGLAYAPDLWVDETLNPNFFSYLRNQVNLNTSSISSWILKSTIRKYYPEFSAETILEDITAYENEFCYESLTQESMQKLLKLKIPADLAEYMVDMISRGAFGEYEITLAAKFFKTKKTNATSSYVKMVIDIPEELSDIQVTIALKHAPLYTKWPLPTDAKDYLFQKIITVDGFHINDDDHTCLNNAIYALGEADEEKTLLDQFSNGHYRYQEIVDAAVRESQLTYA